MTFSIRWQADKSLRGDTLEIDMGPASKGVIITVLGRLGKLE